MCAAMARVLEREWQSDGNEKGTAPCRDYAPLFSFPLYQSFEPCLVDIDLKGPKKVSSGIQ